MPESGELGVTLVLQANLASTQFPNTTAGHLNARRTPNGSICARLDQALPNALTCVLIYEFSQSPGNYCQLWRRKQASWYPELLFPELKGHWVPSYWWGTQNIWSETPSLWGRKVKRDERCGGVRVELCMIGLLHDRSSSISLHEGILAFLMDDQLHRVH